MKIAIQIFFLCCVLLCSINAFTQHKSVDSLETVLKSQKEDTGRITTMENLATILLEEDNEFNKGLSYAKEALLLAEKLNFKKGQAKAHSLIGVAYFQQGNYTEALNCFFLTLKMSKEIDDKSRMASAYRCIGDVYSSQNNRPEAIKNYRISLDNAQKCNDKGQMIYSYLSIGSYYFDEGNYPESIKNHYSALKLSEEIGNKRSISDCLDNLSYVYNFEGDYAQAVKYSFEGLEINKELNNTRGIASCYSRIGDEYLQMGKYSESLQMFFASLKDLKELVAVTGDSSGSSYVYNSIGNAYEKQGDSAKLTGNKEFTLNKYSDANKNYLNALKLFRTSELSGIASDYLDLGSIDIKLGNIQQARSYLEKGLQLSETIQNKENLKTGYYRLAILDSLQGNYKLAYEHYKSFIIYRDSLVNEKSSRKLLQTQMQFDFDKKESIAKAEQDKKDADAKRIKNQQYLVIASLAILVLAVLIIAIIQLRSNKQKQKANLLLERQKQKVETTLSELKSTQSQLIQSEKMASLGELTAGIAHEIQNPLNFVNNFSEVNKEMLEELKAERLKPNAERNDDLQNDLINDVIANEEKINHHGKRADAIVKGMLQHSRSSTGVKERTDINALADEYLRLAYHGLRAKEKSFNAMMKTDFDDTISNINIIPQDIGRVLLNLYNNAFYAVNEKIKTNAENYQPTVSVQTKKLNDKILLTVMDNGNGIPQKVVDKIFQPFFTTKPTGQGTGLGLSLSYDIIKAHDGEIKVKTKEGEGTEFIIQLAV